MWKYVSATLTAVLGIVAGLAIAQQAQESSAPKDNGAEPANAAGPQVPQVPHPNQQTILIRSTLIAVNQANLTGNYTVLRELGTAGFQHSNTAARLSDVFKSLRDRNLDLGPIAVIGPRLTRQPSVNAKGQLRLTGYFPSRPEQVNFDLAFYMRDGRWRLDGIALNVTPSSAPNSGNAAAKPRAPSASNTKPEAPKAPAAAAKPQASAPDDKTSVKTQPSPPEKKASAAQPPPNVEERVDRLEAAPTAKDKSKAKGNGWNPFSSF